MSDQTVCVIIDGQEVRCPAGCTVYEAATAAGIHIPTFCHHPKLVPVGACRQCLVEVEGMRGLQTACTTPVRDNMVVKVHTSPAAVKARKANIEFLLTNHPLDCPVCDKGGECPLQNQAMQDGPGQSRYVEEKRHKNKRYPLSELIVLDQERCVLCWRCIRFLDEWADDHELDLFGRGADTRIDTFPGRPLRSKWQGNTIDICPVGALTSRIFRFEARVWELTNTPSVCPMCGVGCNIVLGVKNQKVRRITPRENMEVNDTWICDKGRFAHGFVDHPDRLKTPLIRRNGKLEPATWEEALALIATRLNAILQEDGPQAVAALGSNQVTNEANYLLQRFMRVVLGTNNVDHIARIPAGATPLTSLPGLEHRDVIVLLGCDPSTEAPLVELWIKKAVLRHGARVLVANPHQIELCRYGGPWLGYRPGGEVALLNGLVRAVLDVGAKDQPARAANIEDARSWFKAYTPERVESLCGTPAVALRQAAEVLVQARRPLFLVGPAWTKGSGEQRAFDALANLTLLLNDAETGFVAGDANAWGALQMGVAPHWYPGQQPCQDPEIRNRLSSFWGTKLSPVPGLDWDGMLSACAQGRLKGMWIIGSDPAHRSQTAGEALKRIPFLVVQDLFMTETASLAEVVLPTTSFAETEGTFTNLTGRLQMIRPAKRPPGQARPDWWIITELARRMVESKRQKSWDFASAASVFQEIAKVVPGYRGLSYTTLGEAGWQAAPVQAKARRHLVHVESDPPSADPNYPLELVTGRLLYDRGTLLRRASRIQNLVPSPYVIIHPDNAKQFSIAHGDPVWLISSQGQLLLTAQVSDEIVPGTVFVPWNVSDPPLGMLLSEPEGLTRVRLAKQE